MSRLLVISSFALGVFFLLHEALSGVSLYTAFLEGCAATGAVMALGGFAQRLYRGARLQSVQLPGGAGASFESKSAGDDVRAGLDNLSAEVARRLDVIEATQEAQGARLQQIEERLAAGG